MSSRSIEGLSAGSAASAAAPIPQDGAYSAAWAAPGERAVGSEGFPLLAELGVYQRPGRRFRLLALLLIAY